MPNLIDIHPAEAARLPAEVFDRIVADLGPCDKEDLKLLKTLSLVCQRFRKTSQAEIFSFITIVSDRGDNDYAPNKVAALASCITARPALASNLRVLAYYFKSAEDEETTSATENIDVFLKLPHLKVLAIRVSDIGAMWDNPANIAPYVPKSNPNTKFGYSALIDAYAASAGSRLTRLRLEGVTIPVYDILIACTHLEYLALSMVSITSSSPLPASVMKEGFPLGTFILEKKIYNFPAKLFGYLRNVHVMRLSGIMLDMTGKVQDAVFKHLSELSVGAGEGIWRAFQAGSGTSTRGLNGEISAMFPVLGGISLKFPDLTEHDEYPSWLLVDIKDALPLIECCPCIVLNSAFTSLVIFFSSFV